MRLNALALALVSATALVGCATAQGPFGNGADPFLDRSAYLAFAPCSFTWIAPSEPQIGDSYASSRWEGCVGRHSPTSLGYEQWTSPKTIDAVIDELGFHWAHMANERTDATPRAWEDGPTIEEVAVTYTVEDKLQAYVHYARSADGYHGFMCHFDSAKLEPAGERSLGDARALCADAIADMAIQLDDARRAQ